MKTFSQLKLGHDEAIQNNTVRQQITFKNKTIRLLALLRLSTYIFQNIYLQTGWIEGVPIYGFIFNMKVI